MRDGRVLLRVEDVVVDSVEDPVQLVGVAAQQLVEPLPVFRRLDLLRIALAHGVHHVREVDAAPEHVHDVVEAGDAEADEPPFLQARQHQRPEPEHALRGQVVDRERRGDVLVGPARVHAVEQVRDQRAPPVVDVDDLGEELQRRQHLEHSAAEVDRARVIVAEPEHAVAVEQRRAVDEVHDELAKPSLEDGRRHHLRPQRHRQVAHHRLQAVPPDVDLAVARKDDTHVMAQAV